LTNFDEFAALTQASRCLSSRVRVFVIKPEVILRRRAGRRGLRVERSRRRDTAALGYGLYRIVDTLTGEVYAGDGPGGYALTLSQVEQILGR
jgi:hypothetical protein